MTNLEIVEKEVVKRGFLTEEELSNFVMVTASLFDLSQVEKIEA